jgi:hypothetical protein
MADDSSSPVTRQRQRSSQCWQNRSGWDHLYREAYDYVLPNRRPGGLGKMKAPASMIFDMTGPNSAIHCAGEIQRQVFPANTPFTFETGPLVASHLQLAEKKAWDKQLNAVAQFCYPFFKTGDFDTAMHETCTDLTIGTGALLPLKGPSINEPLCFVNVPQDEIAISQDGWGRINFVSWKRTNMQREQILGQWPQGQFPSGFAELARAKPYEELTVYQDFMKLPDGRWRFVAYLEREGGFLADETYLTQPIAVSRFYRWPGEAYGRGPVLFALPTIKTVNKAQELTLKAAAIQMLGIWGFRAGGTFNPDTVRVGPGEFWPMQSTGGLLGPDVTRLDPAAGRLDVAKLIIGSGQNQIREALLDTRLVDDGGTPASASEVAARVRQNANVHVGAYGRLNREIVGVIVPRAMEILNDWRILPNLLSFNELLVAMYINSPLAAALKADELAGMVNYMQLVASVRTQEGAIGRDISVPRFLDIARAIMMVKPEVLTTEAEQKAAAQQQAAQQLAATAGEAAVRAAPQLVQAAANGNQQPQAAA